MRAIITWHSIDPSGSPISVTREEFENQLGWLEYWRVRVVSLSELVALPAETDAAALTFDDGLASVATEAAPRLAERGWRATLFAVTRRVGLDNQWPWAGKVPIFPLLDWDALGRLQEAGWEIGSHTRNHPTLGLKFDEALHDEVVGAADDIEARLGARPAAFAYPFGNVTREAAALVASHYRWGCTTRLRPLDEINDPARLSRLDAWFLRRYVLTTKWGSTGLRNWLGIRRTIRAIRKKDR